MDYLLERLGSARFQKLCQALLVKEFPNVQCLPVEQPDGGRDAIMYVHQQKSTKDLIIFQVKFSKNPQTETDPHKWLLNIIKGEAPKVKRLLKEGATAYYLLTNVSGTSHPNVGSIDQARALLIDKLEIPSECWWRDDLERRLDNAWDLKWAYPEILTGQDMLRYILEAGLQENQANRITAIKAFIRKQCDDDKDVRFKEIELESKLIDLFVDVPMTIKVGSNHDKVTARKELVQDFTRNIAQVIRTTEKPAFAKEEQELVGAAAMLLHPSFQEDFPQIVIEGAPGQGKSTITQYICQVHRMYILRMKLDEVPKHHRPISVRIPFRIDLRHLATWLKGQNPFLPDDSNKIPDSQYKSLETFLAAQVSYQSGGIEFSVTDLHRVAELSALLLVLDGLDEVADISMRQNVVKEVTIGVNRLRDSAASLQVVVTSRPTTFANSPGFPEDSFPYFELASLTKNQIDDYANRWAKSRALTPRAEHDLKRTLNEKLNEPHLRELARNPMQLAILLTLVNSRSFLPDARTALYDSYVERYFDREAEKSEVVKNYRDVLIDIHRYIAWVLHSEAEQGRERGSISKESLKRLIYNYLTLEGRDAKLVEQIFTGSVDRIHFLVARVEDIFEFEVQPLREYFVARYLYETAPYSPPGAEKKGTKPDIFKAIARNFYLLNVTRFFAGCFSKGELPTLVDELQDLMQEEKYLCTSHPLSLALMLLSDHVFSQKQRSMQEVVSLILDGIESRHTFSSQGFPRNLIVLPTNGGKDELIDKCFAILKSFPPLDYARELVSIIKSNASEKEILNKWLEVVPGYQKSERTLWLEYGSLLGLLSELPMRDLEHLFFQGDENPRDLLIALESVHFDFFEMSESRCETIVNSILNGIYLPQTANDVISTFTYTMSVKFYSDIFRISSIYRNDTSFTIIWSFFIPWWEERLIILQKIRNYPDSKNKILRKCIDCLENAMKEYERPIKEWIGELSPWESIVENLRLHWGEQWTIYSLANLSGIVKLNESGEKFPNLLDATKSLCKRIQYAKSHSGETGWWRKQFARASSRLDLMFISLVLLTWGDYKTILDLAEFIDNLSLSSSEWISMIRELHSVRRAVTSEFETNTNLLISEDFSLPEYLSEHIAVAIETRATKAMAAKLYEKYLLNYQGSETVILEYCQKIATTLVKDTQKSWRHLLRIVEKLYATIPSSYSISPINFANLRRDKMPVKIAQEIMTHTAKYPREIVYIAEVRCRELVASKIVPVGETAKVEPWSHIPQLRE